MNRSPLRTALAGLALSSLLTAIASTQPADQSAAQVREHYTKFEHRVPMRDGVRLFTSVYVPKACVTPRPIVLERTPYSVAPYGPDAFDPTVGPSDHFMRANYIVVYQDVRGRYMSEGVFENMRPHRPNKRGPGDTDESTDTWDTVDWLVKHVPCNNGRVGLWGVSYAGFFASAGMIEAHPALKAVSPQAPVTDLYLGDDVFHNGAFLLAHNFGFGTGFKPRDGGPAPPPRRVPFDYGSEDGYEFYLGLGSLWEGSVRHRLDANSYWMETLEHTTYDDYWRARSLWRHFRNVMPAVLVVGGWFDAEDLMGPLRTYRTLRSDSPSTNATLVMGPWTHGGWARGNGTRVGNLDIGQPTSEFFREKIQWPFFQRHLEDGGGSPASSTPPGRAISRAPLSAMVFETGTNQWREFESWPPSEARATAYYLRAGGKLAAESPTDPGEVFDEYVSDPNRPVPYVGHVQMGMQRDYMTEDQRFAARRPDVLVYQTDVLEEDLTVLGPIKVDLHVSTTGTDSDFVVKVIDAYPNDYPTPEWTGLQPPPANRVRMGGYQQLVRGEPFRGKFRRSFEKPEPFVPGVPDVISFELGDLAHTFRRGHRLMVQVQSSWFPLIDRNPQTFVDIPRAKPEDFRAATQRVYRSASRPSSITLPVAQGLSGGAGL